ncbi:MAG: non-hydrolyzing UDP-N-acetylglucosamine 2-epimerase [Thermodesulfobacteriota bacterium]
MTKRILSIFGTRPEAIKMAPVIKALASHPEQFESLVCATAQHREMLDQVLDAFEIKADFDLNLMQENQELPKLTAGLLLSLDQLLGKVKPDWVLIQGDTTTTMAASLAAFYHGIHIGHIEAGLRTYDKNAPFPEEINRRMTSVIADLHFAPTEQAKKNLIKEGVDAKRIFVTGNTVIDALLMIVDKQSRPEAQKKWSRYFVDKFGISFDNGKRQILVTGHRRESFGKGFENICNALKEIVHSYQNVEIIYPVHLNPNVQEPIRRILKDTGRIHLISPLDYEPFVFLMSKSYFILTDSGGIQEEAPSLGKPVLVMRETTERPEAVKAGTAILVGTDQTKIISETSLLLSDRETYLAMSNAQNPYGDGRAASRIIDALFEGGRNEVSFL